MALTDDERLAWLRGVSLFRGCAERLSELAGRRRAADARIGQ